MRQKHVGSEGSAPRIIICIRLMRELQVMAPVTAGREMLVPIWQQHVLTLVS